ncbi:MAG: acylphosphatase [Fimbriimonadales bacterium]
MRQLRARVYGVVQGVGYRMFAQSVAQGLGLCGYVRNCADGSVEVCAEGEEQQLREFLNALQRGPVGARVMRVDAEYADATGAWDSFTIRR